jgi:TonB family protein
MTHEMFHDVTESSITVGGKRGYTVPLSIFAHAAILAALIVIPLLAVDALPVPPTALSFIAAEGAAPLPPAAPPRTISNAHPVAAGTRSGAAPLDAPPDVGPEPTVPSGPRLPGMIENGGGTIPNGVFIEAALPPSPPAAAPPAVASPVRVGGTIRPPAKIKDVPLTYPAIAQVGRVEGIVIIEATIGVSGKVQDVKVLRSIPLLDAAAVAAVRQWEYTPTLLNGTPVPVIMTVTVAFKLRQAFSLN